MSHINTCIHGEIERHRIPTAVRLDLTLASLALWLALYTFCLALCEAIWFPNWPSSHHCFLLRLCCPKINFLQGERPGAGFLPLGPISHLVWSFIQPGYQGNGLLLKSLYISSAMLASNQWMQLFVLCQMALIYDRASFGSKVLQADLRSGFPWLKVLQEQ